MSKLYIPVLAGTTREQRKVFLLLVLWQKLAIHLKKLKPKLLIRRILHSLVTVTILEGKDARYSAITEKLRDFLLSHLNTTIASQRRSLTYYAR